MKVVGITDIGLIRKKNEDNYLINESKRLFAVCDGMGGHKAGDIASGLAVQVIEDEVKKQALDITVRFLNTCIEKANKVIYQKGHENQEFHEMGTTLTAAVITNGNIQVANVGDSCLYLIRKDYIRKVTRDHTLAEQMVADGLLKNEELSTSAYNHILTRALGQDKEVLIDNFEERIYPGDIILICSDGLSDMLNSMEIMTIVNADIEDLDKASQELLDAALLKGGHDNITFILIRV
jgi:protein phosphatase